mmetsp:Transcript_1524/g.2286  ORF Transcript_1524/g.2286 Transcript_1524/m.2286 type:complete len:671 (-) Transcript_1524:54-2066(-)
MSICNILCVVLALVLKMLVKTKKHCFKMPMRIYKVAKEMSLIVFFVFGLIASLLLASIVIPLLAIIQLLKMICLTVVFVIQFLIHELKISMFWFGLFLLLMIKIIACLLNCFFNILKNFIALCLHVTAFICFLPIRIILYILDIVLYNFQRLIIYLAYAFFYCYYYLTTSRRSNSSIVLDSSSLNNSLSPIPIDGCEHCSLDSGGSASNSDANQKDPLKRKKSSLITKVSKSTQTPPENYYIPATTPGNILACDTLTDSTFIIETPYVSSDSIFLVRSLRSVISWIIPKKIDDMCSTSCGFSSSKVKLSQYSHVTDHIHSVFHPIYEFIRQGIPENNFVFVNQVNSNHEFTICPSYPATFVVPRLIQNVCQYIKESALWRDKKRLPALTYYHKDTSVGLYRSSEPLSKDVVGDHPYLTKLASKEKKLKIIHCHSGLFTGPHSLLPDAEDLFDFSIANIVGSLGLNFAIKSDSNREIQLDSLIRTSQRAASYIRDGHNVLVQCSDGYDQSAQVCALAKFILDPYYHTKEGFQCLFEMDFMAFGHQLASRSLNSPIQDIGETGPIITQLLVCILKIIQDEKLNLPWFKKVSSCILSIIYNDPCVYSFIDRSPFKSLKIYQEYARAFMRNNSFVLLDRDAQRWKMKKDLAFSKRLQNEMNYLFDHSCIPEVRI